MEETPRTAVSQTNRAATPPWFGWRMQARFGIVFGIILINIAGITSGRATPDPENVQDAR
ncbi:hypothetical protein [Marivita sp.]|uniref:hypothetical protein n=1 Tax=Marivita sp. TaxID=2003365 RepID=UPI0025C422B1|nr:hypothetical protein [Marivita sp.]